MIKILMTFFLLFPLWQYGFADDIKDKINNKEYILAGGTGITISFYNNRVAGGSGVNYYTGSYEIVGDEIRFGNIGVTKRMGSKDDMRKEQEYLEFLKGSKKIELSGNKLFIGGKIFIEIENKNK